MKLLKRLFVLSLICLSLFAFAGCDSGRDVYNLTYCDLSGYKHTLKPLYKYEIYKIEMLESDENYTYKDNVLEDVTIMLEHKFYWTNSDHIVETFEDGRYFIQQVTYPSLGFEIEGIETGGTYAYPYSTKHDCYVRFKAYVGKLIEKHEIRISYSGEHCNIIYPQQISAYELGNVVVESNQISIPQQDVNIIWGKI